jgi:lysozyme
MARAINAAGLSLIEESEGCELTAYQDQAGVWTIGYGHTGIDVRPGMTIDQVTAELDLAADIGAACAAVDGATKGAATDNQFAAFVSLAYNIGSNAFRGSTALRRHLAGDYEGAADAILWWDKAHQDGQLVTVPGLFNRRNAERTLYLTP